MKRKERYLKMFIGLGNSVQVNEPGECTMPFRKAVNWAMKHLRKDDRIVWYLSIVQRSALLRLRESGRRCEPKINRKIERKLKGFQVDRIHADFNSNFREAWIHYESLLEIFHLGRMKDYAFYNKDGNGLRPKSVAKVLRDHDKMDKQLQELSEGERYCSDGKPFIKFDDGWAWFIIDDRKSEQEARAMRHCGNAIGKAGDHLLSLREPVHKGELFFWKPHLTFILNCGSLGEMKGYANTKPKSCYHYPYVERLLQHPRVREIQGGGYMPTNNFSFFDLEEEGKCRVLEKKPDLVFDPFGSEGEVLIEGEGFRWIQTDKPLLLEQVRVFRVGTLGRPNSNTNWIVCQTPINFSGGTAWTSLAWFDFRRGTVGALKILPQEPSQMLEKTLPEVLLLPQLERFVHDYDPLAKDSIWGQALGTGGCCSLMREKPAFFNATPLNEIWDLTGLSEAYLAIIKHRFSLNFQKIKEGIELQQFDSLYAFAEETCNGRFKKILEQSDATARCELLEEPPFEVPWLRLCPTEGKKGDHAVSLVLTSGGADIFFEIMDFQNIEDFQGIVPEIIYRFGLRRINPPKSGKLMKHSL